MGMFDRVDVKVQAPRKVPRREYCLACGSANTFTRRVDGVIKNDCADCGHVWDVTWETRKHKK